ncbi:MAG: NADH-quinone oxidoreductase subunit J [Desulfomonile tiedjei]|nr:NADH-quinone oxidoreductase subunit J [Desulfomonile tiedjei]
MTVVFYVSAAVAVISTIMVITRLNAVHALLYLILSLLSVALIFFALGAPFVAALEVIIYAGAIMVLFIFAIMILNLGPGALEQERVWLKPGTWRGPGLLAGVLLCELLYVFVSGGNESFAAVNVSPKEVGIVLFGPYLLGVELASLLLMAGLIGAYHLGRRIRSAEPEKGEDS